MYWSSSGRPYTGAMTNFSLLIAFPWCKAWPWTSIVLNNDADSDVDSGSSTFLFVVQYRNIWIANKIKLKYQISYIYQETVIIVTLLYSSVLISLHGIAIMTCLVVTWQAQGSQLLTRECWRWLKPAHWIVDGSVAHSPNSSALLNSCNKHKVRMSSLLENGQREVDIITRIKNIKNVTRCRDSRSAKSIETR